MWVGLQLSALVLVKAAMPNSFAYALQIQLNKNKTLIQTICFDLVPQKKLFKWFPYYLAKPGTYLANLDDTCSSICNVLCICISEFKQLRTFITELFNSTVYCEIISEVVDG